MSHLHNCPHCQQTIRLPANFGGGNLRCPQCQGVISVPAQAVAHPVTPASAFPSPSAQPPQPRGNPQRAQPKRKTPVIVWVLGTIFGGGLLVVLLCAGLIGLAISRAKQVDERFAGKNLLEARRGYQTKLRTSQSDPRPPETPPQNLFSLVTYPTDLGPAPAYLGVDPGGGSPKHPAMIWLFGGFSNSIGSTAWDPASPSNDQSARAFREAGVIMMYPALRGGSGAPGTMEGFYGEVNDVLAAADFLAQQPNVDPDRIYLGGHSTGGSLALLCAAASRQRFRAVFAFGPVDRLGGYGQESLPYSVNDQRECELRDPIQWLHAIETPTFAIEGSSGNAACIYAMKFAPAGDQVQFHIVQGADHFDVLAPITRLLAEKVTGDDGPDCNIQLNDSELNRAFKR